MSHSDLPEIPDTIFTKTEVENFIRKDRIAREPKNTMTDKSINLCPFCGSTAHCNLVNDGRAVEAKPTATEMTGEGVACVAECVTPRGCRLDGTCAHKLYGRASASPSEAQKAVAWVDRHELSIISDDFEPTVSARQTSEYDVPLYTHPSASAGVPQEEQP